MFSLIITIIAIAFVAALAGASVYYGGSAFNQGTAGADASTLINQGQQVNVAVALATVAGDWDETSTDVDTLSPEYLTQVPNFEGSTFSVDGDYVTLAGGVINQDVCDEVNERAGTTPADLTEVELFGCYENGATENEFAYKI